MGSKARGPSGVKPVKYFQQKENVAASLAVHHPRVHLLLLSLEFLVPLSFKTRLVLMFFNDLYYLIRDCLVTLELEFLQSGKFVDA